MTDPNWKRLQELFDELLVRPRDTWNEWLASVESNPDVRREAVALALADHDSAGELARQVGRVAALATTPGLEVGTRIGAYRLVREIGAGGMGSVFLAERIDAEFDRQVAVKLLRGIPTHAARERLRRERQILADLRHPNIARLLDGGTTDDGQPYLVLEYVDGRTIGDYCRAHALGVDARLRLVQRLCRAVHYAHQHLVIHRDLKPGNVLVTDDGEPVLLDFGIAKLLDDTGDATQTANAWMTPAYASPEQKRGDTLSTATDIYGLGVVLYELLTGRAPAPSVDGRLPRPSDVGPPATTAHLRGDVDNIVAKAAHPEAARRYASAEALDEDIERFLSGRPVQAASDSVRYRVGKFAQRHRWSVAAAVGVLLLSIAFVWQLALERNRARAAEAAARIEARSSDRVADYLVSIFENATPDDSGQQAIRPIEMIDTAWEQLHGQLEEEPFQRARLLIALGRIYNDYGSFGRTIEAANEAIAIERTRAPGRRLSQALYVQGFANANLGRLTAAEAALNESAAILKVDPEATPGGLAKALTDLSHVQSRLGKPALALATAQEALALVERGDERVRRTTEALNALAEAYEGLGRYDDARETAQRSLATLRADTATWRPARVGHAHAFLGQALLSDGKPVDAEAQFRAVLAEYEPVTQPDSLAQSSARSGIARALERQGRLADAIALLARNVDVERARPTPTPALAQSLCGLGALHALHGDDTAAEALLREGVAAAQRVDADGASGSGAACATSLVCLYARAGRADDAERTDATLPPLDGTAGMNRLVCSAELARARGRPAVALQHLRKATDGLRERLPPTHVNFPLLARVEGAALRESGRHDDAERVLRAALDGLRRYYGEHANPTLQAQVELALTLAAAGRRNDAVRLGADVAPRVRAQFVDGARLRQMLDTLLQDRSAAR